MPIDYRNLMAWPIPDARQVYGEKDCILYALGIGFGTHPLEVGHLRHVYESGLEAFPAMAMVLATGGPWARNPETGIDYSKVVHAEQSFVLHRPLPVSGAVHSRSRLTGVVDKGEGRGAIVTAQRQLFIDGSATPAATLTSSLFCRADGGFGGPAAVGPRFEAMPDRAPDIVTQLSIPAHLALIYRLSGDYNALHADPDAARRAGFPAPILHGLCSFGIALRSVAEGLGIAPKEIVGAGVRFTAPVYPGETLETSIWRQGEGAMFRTRAVERNAITLNLGRVQLG